LLHIIQYNVTSLNRLAFELYFISNIDKLLFRSLIIQRMLSTIDTATAQLSMFAAAWGPDPALISWTLSILVIYHVKMDFSAVCSLHMHMEQIQGDVTCLNTDADMDVLYG